MTSQKDQIQSLIADIEQVLGAQRSRKPWVKVSEVEPQRQALAKAQDYLKSLQQAFDAPGGWGPVDPSTGQVASSVGSRDLNAQGAEADAGKGVFSGLSVGNRLTDADASAEEVLQALLTEMKFLRSSALEPLRLEMDALRSQRDSLQQEVEGLSEERSTLATSAGSTIADADRRTAVTEDQLNQFLAVLMERLQERLSVQVTQTLEQLESDHAEAIAQLSPADDAEVLQLRPRDSSQLEEMRQIQSRSDQLLVNIESTLQGMFETLQKNIDSYQISLNEGIENMHSLGRQGEVIVRSLVDHLTQQLGQTAPPEPAFFPARSAEPAQRQLTFIDDLPTDSGEVALTEKASAEIDSVSSLDEILPNAATDDSAAPYPQECAEPAETEEDSEELAASIDTFTSPDDSTVAAAADDTVDVAAADSATALRPEDCIREDGTIDLDLLKLDIDRDDDEALTADELMMDAQIADAQVAATEAEDPEIEAKVTPTADAAYLADLTLDDLTLDESLVDDLDESLVDESLVDESLVDELLVDESIADISVASSIVDSPIDESKPIEESRSTPQPAAEADEPIDPTASESKPEPEPEVIDLTSADSGEAETEVTVPVGLSAAALGAAALGGAAAVRADDDAAPIFEELEEMLQEDLDEDPDMEDLPADAAVDIPESALSPDVPDAGDADVEAETLVVDSAPDVPNVSDDIEAVDDSVSSGLATQLEADSQQSVQVAASAVSRGLAALSERGQSDLEEPTVSDDAAPPPSSLSENAPPLESGLIPDRPEDSDGQAHELPSDFDDDLDFYGAEALSPEQGSAGELLETLSTESFDEEDGREAFDEVANELASEMPGEVADELLTEARTTDNPDGFPELPVMAPLTPVTMPATDELLAEETVEPIEPAIAPPKDSDNPTKGQPASWFLGIDVGTTGLSAVLMNQLGDQVYPLCWSVSGDEKENRFRLPAVLQVNGQTSAAQMSDRIGAVGPLALQGDRQLRTIKPLLKVGIPKNDTGEPWIQWSDRQSIPLRSLQTALIDLLKMLSPNQTSCQAVGLSKSSLRWVLSNLKGVVVGYPNNWPDTYSFNVREAVLAAGIVSQPEQVFFVEEAIAALLSALPDPKVADQTSDNQQPGLYNCNWEAGTVVISAGATLTESAIVDLPEDLSQLLYRDFALRSFTYAGDSLDQDIVCQLLHPTAQSRLDAIAASSTPVDENVLGGWQSLGLNRLNLPQSGEADRAKRHRLRQRLNDSPLGREVVMAARNLKQTLQEETQCEITLVDQTWVVKRKDLEAKVFLPYIQRVNRQVNALLSQKGLAAQAVKQVVCTGGSASLGAIARWLRQKFPNATIIQDTYGGEYSNSCSRVAYGLANLCNYPNVLDRHRHQYNDYFLLLELLRVLPEQPLPAGGILHLLEQRGVNTQACQAHVLALIEGHLPPGLVPTEGDRPMISAQSPNIDTYQTLAELPLFRKQGGQIYIADPQQGARLRTHLESLLETKAQSLSKPQTVELAETV